MKTPLQYFLKPLILSSALLFVINFIGCSPVYTIGDYQSKEEFYKRFNADIESEKIIVRLASSDTAFQAQDAVIQNDSLHLTTLKEWKNKKLQKSDIKSAVYYNKNYDNLCAKIQLNNGDSFTAEYIVANIDSTLDYKYFDSVSVNISVKDIKNISHKNYRGIAAGLGYGLLGGAVTGFGLALMVNNQEKHPSGVWGGEATPPPAGFWFVTALIAGPVIGTPAGWIIGGRTTWEFSK